MNTCKKLFPSRKLVVYSILISAIVGYAIYYAFSEGNSVVMIVAIIAGLLILLPIFKIPISVHEDDDSIRIKQIIGERVFLKRDYTVTRVDTKSLLSIRLFATSIFLHWGYFWTKSIGVFYALCVNNSDLTMLTPRKGGAKIVIDTP